MIINRSRLSVLICSFLVLVLSGASALQGKEGKPPAAGEERAILRNEYGAVIRDAKGERINYSREQLEAQRSKAQGSGSSIQPPARNVLPASGPDASWSYATFGSGIGISNIIVAQNGVHREVYSAGGFNSYWIAQRFNPTTQDYDQVYVSPFFAESIRISRIKVADVVGDSAKEILVALQNGQIYVYDQATKALLNTTSTAASGVTGLDVADVDGDSANDLVLCTETHIYVYSGTGVLKWDLTGVGGRDLIVGQMDADSALEIAVTDGNVVDCATHLSQWSWPNDFGARLAAADIDGDGMKELIVAEHWQFVWAYDVDRKLPKWSISMSHDIGAILVADIDGDAAPELLVGQGQWGSVIAFDPVTQQQKWLVQNPEHGITNIAVGDVDGDPASELLWAAGASSTGEDHLYVANWQTGLIEWQNIHLDGPFLGPEIGDLDGDGRDEMVVISWSSDSGYSSGRILVFDAITRKLRATSGPTMLGGGWTGIHDLKLRDVKGDSRKEILVAASFTYDGVIEIYGFDSSNTFDLIWTNATLPSGAVFYSVDAADIDGDGEMEIVGGVGPAAGASGIFIYVYNYNTRNEEWHSLHMGWGAITDLELADVNADGAKEIIGMVNNRDVYIFDGPSKVLETILFGPFTAMNVANVGGLPSIVVGNSLGDLTMYRFSSGSYGQVYNQRLVNARIDGFTIDSQDRVWIGSPGPGFDNPATLTQLNLNGAVLAAYSGYGSTLGLHTAFVPASLRLFTTGSYSVLGFPTCTASLTSTDQTFPASGGTGSVNVIADGTCSWAAQSDADWIAVTSAGGSGNGTSNYSVSANSGAPRSGTITIAGNIFTVTQGAGGTDTIGLFRPSGNLFFLRNFNSFGPPDVALSFGAPGDLPIVGDWDGDGDVTIGLYRPSSSTFFLRNTNTFGPPDLTITYGNGPGGDLPIVGDWNGDGTWTIGVYRPSTSTFFLRNSNSFGVPDMVISFGAPGDMPLAGDWDGDGDMTIGLFRPSGNFFFLRNANTAAPPDVALSFGAPGDQPIVGDWDGDGTTTIGLFRPAGNFFFLRNSNTLGPPNIIFSFGAPGDRPIIGNWDGL